MSNGQHIAALFDRPHHMLFVLDEENIAIIHLGGEDVWIAHSQEQATKILRGAKSRMTGKHHLSDLLRSVALRMKPDPVAPPPLKIEGGAGFMLRRALIVYNVHLYAFGDASGPGGRGN